jgi:hypothetical protein
MANKHLAVYLNDHLAGATGALELFAHLEEAHAGTPLGDSLAQLHTEIEADRQELEHLIERLHINVSAPRKVGAWLGEKLAYIKLQLDDKATGAMRLFEGLEALALGIQGKRALWYALAAASEAEPGLLGVDYDRMIQSAESQYRRVELLRLDAAREALTAID